MEAHRRAGHTVVLASSATRFQVEPAARAHGRGARAGHPGGDRGRAVCTGRPGGPPLWRAGKAAAVRAFAAGHDIDLTHSYAYSNGDEDVPFLAHRRPGAGAEPGRGAGRRGRAQSLADRAVPLARPAGGRASWSAPSAARRRHCSAASAPGSRSARERAHRGRHPPRRRRPRRSPSAASSAARSAGVTLDVRGAEHLAARPAVFLFNHQSQLDVLILAKLLRGGFTGVAKKEAGRRPRLRAGLPAGRRRVRRPRQHRRRPARRSSRRCERLREGISLVIAPEGTRSATPSLGPFKKGAFHVAMQAGRADRADRHPQRRRADVARRVDDPLGHRAGRRAPAGAHRRLDGRGPRTSTSTRSAACTSTPSPTGRGGPADSDRGRCRSRRDRAAGRAAAGLGHRRAEMNPLETAMWRGGDGRPAAAGQRHAAGAARSGAGLGAAASARTSGRRGWCRGCGSGWSSPHSGSARPAG